MAAPDLPPDPSRLAGWEAVYRANHDTVLRYLLRRTDPHTAQDLVAETFLVAWRHLDTVPAPAAGWLCGTARNLLANHARAGRRRVRLWARLARQPVVPAPGPEEAVSGGTVLAALRSLSPADQEVLLLAAWDRLPPAEAAQVLGCSRGAYDVRLHRARTRLARALERAAPDPPARPAAAAPITPGTRLATPAERRRAATGDRSTRAMRPAAAPRSVR